MVHGVRIAGKDEKKIRPEVSMGLSSIVSVIGCQKQQKRIRADGQRDVCGQEGGLRSAPWGKIITLDYSREIISRSKTKNIEMSKMADGDTEAVPAI